MWEREEIGLDAFLQTLLDNQPDGRLENFALSDSAISQLAKMPELWEDVKAEREKPPLPSGYTPTIVELFYDDLLFIRSVNGQITYLRNCSKDYAPCFFEVRFDDQMALFMVNDEVLVNRVAAMALLDEQLGRLLPISR